MIGPKKKIWAVKLLSNNHWCVGYHGDRLGKQSFKEAQEYIIDISSRNPSHNYMVQPYKDTL